MRTWIIIVAMIVVLGSFASSVHGANTKAGVTLTIDKSIYVVGERINAKIYGDANTYYRILVDGVDIDKPIITNDTGYAEINITVNGNNNYGNRLGPGTHVIELEKGNTVVAQKEVIVRAGLELEKSEYTGTYTYLGGETLWVHLSGENNKTYYVNITNSTGKLIYPPEGHMNVKTDNNGVAVFNITLNIGDGSYYLNLYNGSKHIQSVHFSVQSIAISADIDKGEYGVYLLSENIKAYVSIYWMKSHTLLKDASYKWWIVDAYNQSASFGPYAGKGTEFTTEKLNFYTMGNNPDVHIEPNNEYYLKIVYENDNSTGKHYAEKDIYFYTGVLSAHMAINKIDGSISPGKRVVLSINTYAHDSNDGIYSPLGHVHVDYVNITITKHWQVIWYKNYTSCGYTDDSGKSQLLWNVPNVEIGSYISIKSKVSTNHENYTLVLSTENGKPLMVEPALKLQISTDRDFYLAGDTINVMLHPVYPSGVSVLSYDVKITSPSGKVMDYKHIKGNEISYGLPNNYSGNIDISVSAHFSTGKTISTSKIVKVYYGYIYLSSSQDYFFKPGDVITIYSEFRSNVMHPNSLTYKVIGDHGLIMRMNASLSSFQFTVPNDGSTSYTIIAEAIDGSYYAENSITISKFEGYFLNTHILTNSKYQSKVYEPGQSIKIAYNITKYGNFVPHVIVLHWEIMNTNYHWEKVINENEFSGVISLSIPKDLKGGYLLHVWVSDGDDHWSTDNVLTINVEKGSWAMQDVSGMPMLSLINLILVLVAIAIGIVALILLVKGKKGGKGGETEEKEEDKKEKGEKKHGEKLAAPMKNPFKKKKKGAPKPYSPDGNIEERKTEDIKTTEKNKPHVEETKFDDEDSLEL